MTFKEIQELIKQLNRSKLAEFRLKNGEFELTIRTQEYYKAKSAPTAQAPAPAVVPMPAPVMAAPAAPPAPAAAPAEPAAPAEAEEKAGKPVEEDTSRYVEIRSPMVGTFYRSPAPDKPPFVKVGDRVEKGQVVCIIEAMKLFNEIESEVSGTIVKVCVEDATPVEYDQVLFLVDPAG
ncbi:MAG: acetyl-CoA carboxylase biotin carboxyl carrier protein [Bacteroidetes bacterium]|nr:MAG: acetyl-CoA carboxylase biotin carboxyl carrier protein [Bacteroidota bacterium]